MEDSVDLMIIDDDSRLLSLLSQYLPRFSISVHTVDDPREGLALIRQSPPDLAILDVSMPGLDGFELCREIRKFSSLPIIMLSARGEATDKIIGLELGADDYMSKPFEPRELVTRIRAVLRRTAYRSVPPQSERCFGDLVINLSKREAYLAGKCLSLTTMEYELLTLLTEEAGKTYSREEIFTKIQGFDGSGYSRSVDILISRLRTKLGDRARSSRFIKSIHGYGYAFIGTED